MRHASSCTIAVLTGSLLVVGPAHSTAQTGLGNVEPQVSTSVVINEVATRRPNGELDEYLELRNVSTIPRDLGDFQLRFYGSSCASPTTLVIPEGMVLSPMNSIGQFLVLTGLTFSGTVVDDTNVLTLPSAGPAGFLPQAGAVSLVDIRGAKVDAVAWSPPSTATCRQEGNPARTPPPSFFGVSMARDLLSTDSDDNRCDFGFMRESPGEDY